LELLAGGQVGRRGHGQAGAQVGGEGLEAADDAGQLGEHGRAGGLDAPAQGGGAGPDAGHGGADGGHGQGVQRGGGGVEAVEQRRLGGAGAGDGVVGAGGRSSSGHG